jgi:HEAT repeat protein
MGLFGPPNVQNLEAKRDVQGLINALEHEKDAGVREAAAQALGRIGDPRAVEHLFVVVQDRNSPELCRQGAAEALGRIGAPAVQSLSAALMDSNVDTREAAVRVLGHVGAPAVESLSATLKDSTAGVREAAARALGEIGDPRAVEPLSAVLTDSSAGVRQSAARALSRIGWTSESGQTGEAYRLIEERDWSECVRLGSPAVDPLVDALKRRGRRVRRAAAETLGKIADPRAAKPLVAALGDSDPGVRQAAAEALVKMLAPAAKPLAAALLDRNATRRRLATEVLDRTGWSPDRSRAGASYWIAKRQWSKCVEMGNSAVRPLLWALKYDEEQDRAEAALALGKIGNPRAVEPLIAVLEGEDRVVREFAAEALGQIGDPRAVKSLVAALRDDDGYLREIAADALAQIGDVSAIESAMADLDDEDGSVRRVVDDVLNGSAQRREHGQGAGRRRSPGGPTRGPL